MILNKISHLDKILILGFAREGQSTKNFLHKRFPDLQIDTADQKDGPDYLKHLRDYQIIVKTPGIPPHLPEIISAKKSGVFFTSQTQIFFELCPAKIIGVTGTKGKSTTASLIHHVLSTNGIPCHLVGNIGRPALDYLDDIKKDDWVVMELSSYQLMDLQKSPHIAVLQNIYPDHLDYHTDFTEYQNAKLTITKYQTPADYLITAIDIPTKAKKIIIKPEPIESQLLGRHNLYNIQPAIIIGKLLKIPKEEILAAIKTFEPLDTRLTKVGVVNGVIFYEDVLATIPEATIAALDAFPSGVTTLIAGGHERKQNYSELAHKILDTGIKSLVLFPATGVRIEQALKNLSPLPAGRQDPPLLNQERGAGVRCYHVTSMNEAVQLAFSHTASGEIVLLSPAAPSFTLFKDYRDESSQYRAAIQKLSP